MRFCICTCHHLKDGKATCDFACDCNKKCFTAKMIHSRLSELEEFFKGLFTVSYLQDRLASLEQSHEKLYDCHDTLEKSFERFYEQSQQLDGHVNKLHEMINLDDRITSKDILDRLDKIESCNLTKQLDPQVWKHVVERIDSLETEINTVRALGSRAYHPKKPHKCPVCDGIGKVIIGEIRGLPIKTEKCHSCDGNGIIWG